MLITLSWVWRVTGVCK
ncbi:hypothetical protein AZE42_01242 [Rhizopogon vesiculosus]|uniref:Uncharacterized protein n=1 Tax=Rhizopogon vesiculosus TaxID=180088 RepID=A0A1J8R738_9AGAM|nr:hypothetical protein AZE42_01242 [Rhizopogon vesiculosus]